MTAWNEVSVIVITRNAAAVLDAALASIPPGAEVIVADDGSTDGTGDLARRRGARVVPQEAALLDAARGNFDVARNGAALQATRPWWFFLDADERLTPALAAEIAATLPAAVCTGYDMPRTNLFWGRPVRLLGEDRQLRLVRRGRGRFPDGALHQKMVVDGDTGSLASPLLHENVRNWSDVRERFRRYVPVEAAQIAGRPSRRDVAAGAIGHFAYYYRTMGAWRDGVRGLLVSLIYAAYRGAVLQAARRSRGHA